MKVTPQNWETAPGLPSHGIEVDVRTYSFLGAGLAALLLASGCSSDETNVGTEPTDTSEAVVTLTPASDSAEYCVIRSDGDVFWMSVNFKAHDDIASASFSLVDSVDVTQTGQPLAIAPRKFGQQPAHSAFTEWTDRATAVNGTRLLVQRPLDTAIPAEQWSPVAEETALLAFRLRLAPDVVSGGAQASLGGIRVDYERSDGTSGHSEADVNTVLMVGNCAFRGR